MEKYVAIDHESSKYYKDVPYITKKEFKKIDDKVIVGNTKLKEYKSNSNDEKLDILFFRDNEYVVKNKIYGFKKGYVDVGNDKYIIIKKHIPFLLLFLLLLALLLVFTFPKKEIKEELPKQNIIQEEIEQPIPPVKEEIPNNIPSSVPQRPSKPKEDIEKVVEYIFSFDANGGIGKMNSITCIKGEKCKLPDVAFSKEGHKFVGWSKEKNGELIYSNAAEISSLSQEGGKVTLYAKWDINSFDVTFLDYDDSVIKQVKYNYKDIINYPEEPFRKGYTFAGWDNKDGIVKDNLVIKALYEINSYDIVYNLNGGEIENAPSSYNIEESVIIPKPEKKGYNFIGWAERDSEGFIENYEITKDTIGDIELTANYEPNAYKLIFNTNGAIEDLEPKEIKYDSKFGELYSVTKEGYNFINWTDKDNVEVSENTIFKETNDINIYANWKTITYNLTYNLVGGEIENAPNSFDIESETLQIPNPKKEGYIFLGWQSDDDTFKKDYEIPKGTTGDIELTANYKPITYVINYYSSGGTGTMENNRVKYNNKVNLRKNSFIKEGYVFKGWSIEENGDIAYTDEQQIYNLSNKDNDIINLYAKWEIIKLNVKYYDLFDVLLKDEVVDYGNKAQAPEDPFIEGYTFNGWGAIDEPIKDDTIFKAQYSVNDYIIEYNLNIGNPDDLKQIHYNVESNLFSLPKPTRIGYTFLGWTGSNGLKPEIEINIPKSSTGNKSYKANWLANIYDVTLNPNNGITSINNIKVSYNSLYGILPEAIRSGYIFNGWYYNNDLIKETTVMQKDYDHEIKAKWTPINYRISYNIDGGSMSSQVTSYNIETATFTLPSPTKAGYTFIGWTGSNGSTPNKNVTIEKGSMGDKEYTANYTYDTYSISYNLDGGSANGLRYNYTIDDSFNLPIPWRNGYDFIGWTGSNGSNAQINIGINRGTTGNKSYTANWRKYNANDYNGIYMVSTRDNVTWSYNLDGYYNVGDTNVHSGNWMVTVSDYCVDIVGTKYPDKPYTYQFYIYKANSTSELLATGNASVLGNFQNNARARICW